MTIEQAKNNIGEPFTVKDMPGLGFDTIRSVDPDGTIHGDFLEASAEDCRLKEKQPEALRRHHELKDITNDPAHTWGD